VLQPGRPDPFAQPLVPVRRMMRFSLWSTQQHRVRIQGVVTRQLSDTTLFVREGGAGLKVETDGAGRFKTGDVIDAAGFPVMSDGMAVLRHAVVRMAGPSPAPAPVQPELSALLDGTHNSDLIKMRARLVDWAIAGQNITLIFQTDDHLFKGLFNLPAASRFALPDKNSVVDVTGICVINELEDLWFYQPRSFLLLIADLADVQLVQAPPWWTPERLSRALTIACIVLFAAVGWVWALRRQIERKRAVIEQQTRHAAVLEERSRIARELHDTLEQGLTGLSLQMKAMETDLGGTPHPAVTRLIAARQMLRQSRALARNAIRELRTETLPARLEGLVDGLKRVADSWNHSGALTVRVDVAGTPRPLPPSIENHLLGIGTEAMTNAVKHGRAETIDVGITFSAGEIQLRIRDSGAGFNPAEQLDQASGCFGLIGMRERAREIRGALHIESHPGQGTEVVVSAPTPDKPTVVSPAGDPAATRPTLPMRARPV
jgi:signal transduction histidine kinase